MASDHSTGSGSPRAELRGDKATLPARRSLEHKQVALQSALQRAATQASELDRPDTPDEVVTAVRRLPAVEAAYAPFPADIDPRLRAAFEARGVTQLYTHQAEAYDQVAAGRAGGRHHADRVGQDAVLQPAGARSRPEEPGDARALPVSDQGAGAGPDGRTARAGRASIGEVGGDRDRRAHLRRRYAAGCAAHDPHPRAHRAQQPRHGALGHPAAPSALGEAVREPAVRGDRRTARLPRRVRQPPDQRAAPAAADLPPLRIGSAIHLLVGDHRQSLGAGGAARRETLLRWSSRAARRGARSSSCS